MDHHTLAAISIAGTSLDVLGSLYLAYDLLGGQHGPLRLLTRAVTYSIVFGVGYGIGLGLFLALGGTVQRHSRTRFRGRTLPDSGPRIRNRIRHAHHYRPNTRLFSRHASRNRLCSLASSTPYPASILGHGRSNSRVHCHSACL